jgi:hypothetical protein
VPLERADLHAALLDDARELPRLAKVDLQVFHPDGGLRGNSFSLSRTSPISFGKNSSGLVVLSSSDMSSRTSLSENPSGFIPLRTASRPTVVLGVETKAAQGPRGGSCEPNLLVVANHPQAEPNAVGDLANLEKSPCRVAVQRLVAGRHAATR